jgi:hypothetical protein
MSTLNVSAAVLPEGCSCFTKATFQDLTPTIYEAQSETAYGANRVYANAARARMVGVAPTMLETFLLGRVADVKDKLSQVSVGGDRFVNLPYTVRQRESQITNEYFKITARADNGNTAATGESVLTIGIIEDSLFDAQNGSPIFNQFLPGQYIYVKYRDSGAAIGSQTSYSVPFKVVSSAQGGSASLATVTVIPSITAAGWVALSTAEKNDLKPSEGLVTIGVNNVDDYEQYCDVEAVEIAPQHIIDYHQTSRNAFCYTKEFLEMDKRIQNGEINDYYRTFQYLPVTQRNKQIQAKFRSKWFQAIFYNDLLNELQTPNAYVAGSTPASLTVVDPADNSCILGYKANALGIEKLLANQGQIIDFGGGALDLRVVFEACYAVKRNREIEGGTVDRISAITSRKVYDAAVSALLNYINERYGFNNQTRYVENGTVIDKVTSVSMRYMKFDLPEFDFEFVIAHDNFFTDRERMMSTADLTSHSGEMWILDWSDIEVGVVATNSQKIDENDEWAAKVVDELKCVIATNTIHRTLESTTWTVRLGNEKRSLLVKGFNPNYCIELENPNCTVQPVVS